MTHNPHEEKSRASLWLQRPGLTIALLGICFAFWFGDLFRPFNTSTGQSNFVWDVFGYYSYLPAQFANGGSFEWDMGNTGHNHVGPNGKHFPKYTYGMALLYSPFYGLATVIAKVTGQPADGFSEPFVNCIRWGSYVYVMMGLLLLGRFLRMYFSGSTILIVLLLSLFGYNLFMYTYVQSEMSHGYLFFLFSAFLLLVRLWHVRQKWIYALGLGFVFALIVLIRPTEAFVILFFLFWEVRSREELKLKVRLFRNHFLQLLPLAIFPLLLWVPQLLFYKQHAGTYFYFSYGEEGFFWKDPQITDFLISYRKGWLLYSPLALFALAGILFIRRDFPLPKILFAMVTGIMVYVYSCWWDWGFGGSFGARSLSQHIAYLSIPLAFLVERIFSGRGGPWLYALQAGSLVVLASLILLNVSQTYQYSFAGVIHPSGMSRKLYWDVFRTYHFSSDFKNNYVYDLEEPDYKRMIKGEARDRREFIQVARASTRDTILPPPHSALYLKRFYETCEFIKQDKKWFEQTVQKAKKEGVSVEEQVRKEAEWVLGMEGLY